MDTMVKQNKGYSPLESLMVHDHSHVLVELLKIEERLKRLDLIGLTLGDHNYQDIIYRCLSHSSVNSISLVLEHYQRNKSNKVNFVDLIRGALSSYKSTHQILYILFKYLV